MLIYDELLFRKPIAKIYIQFIQVVIFEVHVFQRQNIIQKYLHIIPDAIKYTVYHSYLSPGLHLLSTSLSFFIQSI